MYKKNTAQSVYFALVSTTDGSAVTGATVTEYVAIDQAVQAAGGGSTTDLTNGQYRYDGTAGDFNGDEIGFLFTAAGAVPVGITISTETKKMADLNDVATGAAMTLAADSITASVYDESTAFPIKSADTGTTRVARTGADGDTLESLSDEIALLPTDADVNAQCDLALSDIHLDHLLGVNYDPAAKPGVATALLNELVENDGGISRFTANALEQSPAATGDASEANQTLILEDLADIKGTGFVKDTDSLVDLAHIGADGDTLETISDQIDGLPTDADVNTQVDAALVTYHLDHLLHTAYAGEGAVGSLLSDLVEDDLGTYRFTTNALEQSPAATGDASAANQTTIITHLTDIKGTGFVKDTDSLVDLAHIGADSDTLATLSAQLDTITNNLSTVDGVVYSILQDTGTTLDTKINTIDGIVDTVKDILEGDHSVNTATSPWQYLIKNKTTAATLVQKDLKEADGTAVTATTQAIGQKVEVV